MLRKVLLVALLGVCCGNIFEQSLKFSPLRKGIHRFAMNFPDTETQKSGSAVDQLQGNPALMAKLQKLKEALLLRGQPLGSFSPDALRPFSGPLTKPSYHHQGIKKARPVMLRNFNIKSCSEKPELDRFVINQLILKPDPVSLPGQLNITFNITVTQTLGNLMAALKLSKRVGETYVEIPCIEQIGSCTYDVCDELTHVTACPPEVEATGFKCSCPVYKGSYVTPPNGISEMIDTGEFVSGDYMLIANLTTQPSSSFGSSTVVAGCYNVTLTLIDME